MDDLSSLKRSILQSLCKKHGIKANGKNVDMIRALEEIRDKQKTENRKSTSPMIMEDPLTHHRSPDLPSPNKPMVAAKKNKSGGRKGGKKRRKISETEREEINETFAPAIAVEAIPPKVENEPSTPSKDQQFESDSNSLMSTSRKRKRRDTHSVSPNSSLSSAPKMARLESPVTTISVEDRAQDYNTGLSSSVSHAVEEVHVDKSEEISTQFTTTATPDNTQDSSDVDEMCCETRLPFTPPSNRSSLTNSRKRKRHSTFTVSPILLDDQGAMVDSRLPSTVDNDNLVEEVPCKKRKRHSTFEITSDEVNITIKASEAVSSTSSNVTSGGDVMAELQNILDKKVEQRKADPDYKPVHTPAASLSSRLPLKTNTQKKFDKAHSKQFQRMKSIVSIHEGKGSPVKRTKLNDKKVISSKVPVPSKRPISYKSTSVTTKTVKIGDTKSTKIFKPVVTSAKKANFRFTEQNRVSTKTPGKDFKTPNKSLMFTAGKKTPSQIKRPVYNIEESLKKKKPGYKPHTGPLPKFK